MSECPDHIVDATGHAGGRSKRPRRLWRFAFEGSPTRPDGEVPLDAGILGNVAAGPSDIDEPEAILAFPERRATETGELIANTGSAL